MSLRSSHFVIGEFSCHDGTEYPVEWVGDRLQALVDVLDKIRSAWGGPLTVVCGYRTAAYNARLAGKSTGVALNSQHIQGRAADIRPRDPSRDNVLRMHGLIKGMHGRGELPMLGGLGYYPSLWCHVDIRPHRTGVLAMWDGSGVGSEQ
jgi:uncharacterized protein YcbK (DUF882 family)